jgi:FAD-dependent urate hydroxylase
MTAIVIGGGIAGLAVGVALKQAGIAVTVFERAPIISEVGAGLTVWSNGVIALDALGLKDRVLAESSVILESVAVTADSRLLSRVDLDKIGRRLGAPSICLSRGKLQAILLGALGSENVRTGRACVRTEQAGGRVRASFEDGTEAESDFLVAADGIQSGVRLRLHPESTVRRAGYISWRGLATRSDSGGLPSGQDMVICARGCQAAMLECGSEFLFWYLTRNGAPVPSASPDDRKAEIIHRIQGWPGVFTNCVNATPAAAILENDLVDVRPLERWGVGRVTFAGDAIHATTPNLGQGAAMGMEDAVVLGRCLVAGLGVEEALREYEGRRKPRTDWIVRESFRVGRVLQMESAMGVRLRESFTRTPLAQWMGERMFMRAMSFQ